MPESGKKNEQHREEMLWILEEYFERWLEKKKFVDTSRIPLICQDIAQIHKRMEKIDDSLTRIVRLIIGALILTALNSMIK